MNTLHVRDYNAMKERKYHEDCSNWQSHQGGFPQIVMYLFQKNYGYVAFDARSAYWRRTKQEAIQAFQKDHPQ